MTYLQFHLAFNAPALVLVIWLARHRLRAAHWKWLLAVSAIALIATTPWDNWAVHERIWDFDWRRVTPVAIPLGGTQWRLPLEEYAFFVLETLLVGVTTLLFLPVPARGSARGAAQ